MQLDEISDEHRPHVAAVIPDSATYDVAVINGVYAVWAVDGEWVHHASVAVTDPRPGWPESTRQVTTARTVTRVEAFVQLTQRGEGDGWAFQATVPVPVLVAGGPDTIPASVAEAMLNMQE
jgi:hypothetical protein